MASSIFLISIECFILFVLFFSNKRGYALSERKIHIDSLLPASVCGSSTPVFSGHKNGASLKVVHRHGPCSHLTLDKSNKPNITEFLTQDQSRVDSIQSRLVENSNKSTLKASKSATLPAKPGSLLGTGNYLVVVGLGSPSKQLSLIFDTGSDLTWTQCQPCVKSCYKQQEAIFDPSRSKTYQNVSCISSQCSQLGSATGNSLGCQSSTCIYGIQYGDQSFSVGFFASETLSLTKTDVFQNFLFGCGENNQGLFRGTAGLLGLGRNPLSIVSQTASKYGKYFSYCLPTSSSSSGYLTFGKTNSRGLKFTPMLTNSNGPSFYFIDIVAIKCGAVLLPISQTIFKNSGSIIDSGTVITRLPSIAYSALRTEFRKQMAIYPSAPALSILDTCYDFSNYTKVTVPIVSFYFGGNVQLPLTSQGILYVGGGKSQVCLAFAGNSDDSSVTIFGNVQQQSLNVVYDVAGGKLGFGQKGC